MKKSDIHIVLGSEGEYSDYREWCVCWFSDKEKADKYVLEAKKQELITLQTNQALRGSETPLECNPLDPKHYPTYSSANYFVVTVPRGVWSLMKDFTKK